MRRALAAWLRSCHFLPITPFAALLCATHASSIVRALSASGGVQSAETMIDSLLQRAHDLRRAARVKRRSWTCKTLIVPVKYCHRPTTGPRLAPQSSMLSFTVP
ncbi:hypothetical protein C8Q72DRAFT_804566 [Fomitopsis betulina]|nr:hypothetical protein C8Q72DRAFT_804566 [Fomitopsis betulina]